MSSKERTEKRVRATAKLRNQLSVLTRTSLKKDSKLVKELTALASQLS